MCVPFQETIMSDVRLPALLLSAVLLVAAGATAADEIPVPSGAAYVAMTPEQRYDLRIKVRNLPDPAQRTKFLDQLKANLESQPNDVRVKLHDERNAMDQKNGTLPLPR
jgi:hypothetical protein